MTAVQRPQQMRNGRFTIIRPLSKGGMGALYLASETIATGARKVVIKEMLDYFDAADPQGQAKAQRRFETEAITLANLSIPGIPQIFDYFHEGGRNYIVMQFIEGQNLESGLSRLDDRGYPIKGKPYPVEQVRRWGIEVCRVLESLSVQNVIHMDIKPANLIQDKSGAVWLVDFGTAKAPRMVVPNRSMPPGPIPGGSAGAGQSPLLQKSSVFGTLGYAAPEQAGGKPETRSDVYALAATLYHLATDDDPGVHPGKFSQLDRLPADFGAALKSALIPNVRKRANAREFSQALEPRITRPLGFHWRDGTISQDPVEIVAAADARWEEARTYFSGQAWENWLQDLHRHDLIGRLSQIKSQLKDPDLGLDAFLRFLNPNLPVAQLHLPIGVMDAGTIPWLSQRTLDLEVQNKGAGVLQVRLVNAPPGIRLIPELLAVHRREILKLAIDSSLLSPSSISQLIPLTLDAGAAGRARLRLRFTIPAPIIEVVPPVLDLGAVYRGQAVCGAVHIRNAGNSAFRCEITCPIPNCGVDPAQFDCLPGNEYSVNICLDTRTLGLGRLTSNVIIQAHAGSWAQSLLAPAYLDVSFLKTFWKYGAPILAWAAAAGFYGGFLGWFLATLVGGLQGRVTSPIIGGLVGAFLGILLCVFPALAVGGLGWLGKPPGKAGLRMGGILGSLTGAIMGGLTGAVAGWIGTGADVFGALVGFLSGAALGVVLQRRLKI